MIISCLCLLTNCSTSKQVPKGSITNNAPLAKPDQEMLSLPFKKVVSGQLRIDGRINGRIVRFVIDTGASRSFLEERHASRYALNPQFSDQTASGIGGRAKRMSVSIVPELEIDKKLIKNFEFGLMDLHPFNLAMINAGEEPIEGLIGADLLEFLGAMIDYPNRTLWVKKSAITLKSKR